MRFDARLLLIAAPALLAQAPAPTAAGILAKAKAALGGAAWDRVAVLESSGDLHTAGLDGVITTLEEVTSGREFTRFDLKVAKGASGADATARWDQDGSGDVKEAEGPEARKEFLEGRFNTMRAWWFPGRAPGEVAYAGSREEGGRRYHVLAVRPRGADGYDLWVDAADWTFARSVATREGRTSTTTFSDYRDVGGVKLPFSIVTTSGDPAFDTRIQYRSVLVNPKVAPGAFDRPRPALGPFGIEGGARDAVVPMEFRNEHTLVMVTLNGKGPYRFFLDTGGVNVLAPSVAKALGLEPQGSVQGGGIGGKDEAFALVKVARVNLGQVWMGDQDFYVIPSFEGIGKRMGLEVHGVVGYELLRRFVARIDSGSTRLTLSLPETWTYSGPGVVVPFTFNGHQPQVEGELDGIPGRFDLDTGSGSTLDVYTPFAKAHDLKAKAERTVRTITGSGVGGEIWGDVYRARELKLGGAIMEAPVVALSDVASGAFAKEGPIGNVGQGFLSRFDLVLDYPGKRIVFEKNASWAKRDRFSMTGLMQEQDRSGRVRAVYPGSPAEKAGIKAGDVVEEVAGRPFKSLTPDELHALVQKPDGTALTLKVRSGAQERAVTLILKDVL